MQQPDATTMDVNARFNERLDMYSDKNFYESCGSYLSPTSPASIYVESLKQVNSHFAQMKTDRRFNKGMIANCEEMLAALDDYAEKSAILDRALLKIDQLEENIGIDQCNLMRNLLEKSSPRSEDANVISRVRSNIIYRKEEYAKRNFNISEEYIQIKRAVRDELDMSKDDVEEINKGILTCTICYDQKIAVCLNPCGHTFCGQCSHKVVKRCFICKKDVMSKTKLYIIGDNDFDSDDKSPCSLFASESNHFVDANANTHMGSPLDAGDVYGFGQ
jgi:hypothetical protein